ncbi:MAG: HlyD family efflux transporter periplasmic adaptor subunit [Candidatus Buchananbacteria bacterium]|nr:HlyD family efflux transporter periplasmic adaptor subunit [Candidatus Buchananbacteria bacterium]
MKWLLNNLKKLTKSKLFWLIVIIIAVVIIILITRSEEKDEYITEKVQKGTLTQTVSETGELQAASEIDLNFKGSGTITEINIQEGDEVSAGDVLARMDAGPLEVQVRQARANLEIARANLNRFLAGASEEDIKVSRESVNNAKIAYENAKRDHTALVDKLESDIETYKKAVSDAKDNLLITLETVMTYPDHSLDIVKKIFEDDDLEPRFSVRNFQYKDNASRYFDLAEPVVERANIALDKAQQSLEADDIEKAVDEVSTALDHVKKTLDSIFLALTASTTSYYFPESALDAYKSSIRAEQTTIDNAIASLNTAEQTWNNAKNNLVAAKNNKELQIANSRSAVDSALGSYNLAQAQLDLKKAAPRPVDVAYYQAQVDQAQAALDLALVNLDDYIIRAPTEGKIVFVNYDVGEQFGVGLTTAETKPVITILSKGDFEIEVDVPESDIVKIQIGNPAVITLDAYGEDVKFDGQVVFVDLAETNIQDVVYYKVTVTLEPTDKEIKSGMTANVDILTKEKQDALFVPVRAVKEDNKDNKYVEILSLGEPQRVDVKTGLRGDQGLEIISGLSENQEVITYKREN